MPAVRNVDAYINLNRTSDFCELALASQSILAGSGFPYGNTKKATLFDLIDALVFLFTTSIMAIFGWARSAAFAWNARISELKTTVGRSDPLNCAMLLRGEKF